MLFKIFLKESHIVLSCVCVFFNLKIARLTPQKHSFHTSILSKLQFIFNPQFLHSLFDHGDTYLSPFMVEICGSTSLLHGWFDCFSVTFNFCLSGIIVVLEAISHLLFSSDEYVKAFSFTKQNDISNSLLLCNSVYLKDLLINR